MIPRSVVHAFEVTAPFHEFGGPQHIPVPKGTTVDDWNAIVAVEKVGEIEGQNWEDNRFFAQEVRISESRSQPGWEVSARCQFSWSGNSGGPTISLSGKVLLVLK